MARSLFVLLGPASGQLIDLVEAIVVLPHQLKLHDEIGDGFFLFDLLVQEPFQEGQGRVFLFVLREFKEAAYRGGDPLFVAQAGLEGLEWRFVVDLWLGQGLEDDLAIAFDDVVEELAGVLEFFVTLQPHPFGETFEWGLLEISGHAQIGISGGVLELICSFSAFSNLIGNFIGPMVKHLLNLTSAPCVTQNARLGFAIMKKHFWFAVTAAACLLAVAPTQVSAQNPPLNFIYETPREFFGSGDFDGDGRTDLVIVDKESGKFRLGYQQSAGVFAWVDCRSSGLKGIAGFSIGKLLAPKLDGLAFASADANQLTLQEAASATAPGKPLVVPFTAGLGPNTIVALDIGGEAGKPLSGLYIGSICNAPDPCQANLLRNDGAEFPKLADLPLPGPAVRANRLSLKTGQPELLCILVTAESGDTFRAESFVTGKEALVATLPGLPAGSDYAVGNFRGSPLREFIFYKPGESKLPSARSRNPPPASSSSPRATASISANRSAGSSRWPGAAARCSSSFLAPARRPGS